MKTLIIPLVSLLSLSALSAPDSLCGFKFGSKPKPTMAKRQYDGLGRLYYVNSFSPAFRLFRHAYIYYKDNKLVSVSIFCELPKKSNISDCEHEYNAVKQILEMKYDISFRDFIPNASMCLKHHPFGHDTPFGSIYTDSDGVNYILMAFRSLGRDSFGKPCDFYRLLFSIDFPKFPLDSSFQGSEKSSQKLEDSLKAL